VSADELSDDEHAADQGWEGVTADHGDVFESAAIA
jgi:hypothetical protein